MMDIAGRRAQAMRSAPIIDLIVRTIGEAAVLECGGTDLKRGRGGKDEDGPNGEGAS